MANTPSMSPLPPSPQLRRRSSTMEAFQDVQTVLKSSTEQALAPTAPETTFWNSVPLAFALLPAVAGLFFTNGHVFVGDFILLALSAWFLHWLIKFPWEWYHESQSIQIPDPDPYVAIIEEDEDEDDEDASEGKDDKHTVEFPGLGKKTGKFGAKHEAVFELERNQNAALLCCFIGPLLGGWLLHTIRSQLSRPGESLLSTFNITVFILGAELRPSAQVIKLIRNRGAYLQSIVHHPPLSKVEKLQKQVDNLTTEVQELMSMSNNMPEDEVLGTVRKGMQLDLDALNRAVRRYEKKDLSSRTENEVRFAELEQRIQDALILAAAAATTAQQNQSHHSLFYILVANVFSVVTWPVKWSWRLAIMPARLVESMTAGRKLLGRTASSTASTRGPRLRQIGERRKVMRSGKGKLAMQGQFLNGVS